MILYPQEWLSYFLTYTYSLNMLQKELAYKCSLKKESQVKSYSFSFWANLCKILIWGVIYIITIHLPTKKCVQRDPWDLRAENTLQEMSIKPNAVSTSGFWKEEA